MLLVGMAAVPLSIAILVSSQALAPDVAPAARLTGLGIDAFAHVAVPLIFMALGGYALQFGDRPVLRVGIAIRYLAIPLGLWSVLHIALGVAGGDIAGVGAVGTALAVGVASHFWVPYALLAAVPLVPLIARGWGAATVRERAMFTAGAMILAMLDAAFDAHRAVDALWPHLALRHLAYLPLGALAVGGRWLTPARCTAMLLVGGGAAAVAVGWTGSLYAFDHFSPFVIAASIGAFGLLSRLRAACPAVLAWLGPASVHAYLAQAVAWNVVARLDWHRSPFGLTTAIIVVCAVAMGAGTVAAALLQRAMRERR